MFTHCVFFWLKEHLSPSEEATFQRGLSSLTRITGVVQGSAGPPAATDRPVVDRSYSYGLMVRFEDKAAHDAYQVDPIHKEFLASCGSLWKKVLVYDFVDF